jgi:hypothetical protein
MAPERQTAWGNAMFSSSLQQRPGGGRHGDSLQGIHERQASLYVLAALGFLFLQHPDIAVQVAATTSSVASLPQTTSRHKPDKHECNQRQLIVTIPILKVSTYVEVEGCGGRSGTVGRMSMSGM